MRNNILLHRRITIPTATTETITTTPDHHRQLVGGLVTTATTTTITITITISAIAIAAPTIVALTTSPQSHPRMLHRLPYADSPHHIRL